MYASDADHPAAGGSTPLRLHPALEHLDIVPALRMARHLMHSDDLAHDAVQEALFALWSGDVCPPNPRAWLVHAVVHRCLHTLRCHRRRRHREEEACRQCSELLVADPLLLAQQAELRSVVQEALASLPPAQREILVLREIEDLDYQGIANELGVALGTVRSRLSRARLALREVLRLKLSEEVDHAQIAS